MAIAPRKNNTKILEVGQVRDPGDDICVTIDNRLIHFVVDVSPLEVHSIPDVQVPNHRTPFLA